MTSFNEEISQTREVVEKAYQNVLNASKRHSSCEEAKSRVLGHLDSMAGDFKKTSEERKYIESLKKNFTDINIESIKFFIEKSYDRFEEINNVLMKFDDNFEEKEQKRYKARHEVLKSLMIFLITENI